MLGLSGVEQSEPPAYLPLDSSYPGMRAFEILGLQSINKTVENGVVIGPATLLSNPYNPGMLGITEGRYAEYLINNIPQPSNILRKCSALALSWRLLF
jgi:hypothetical protein